MSERNWGEVRDWRTGACTIGTENEPAILAGLSKCAVSWDGEMRLSWWRRAERPRNLRTVARNRNSKLNTDGFVECVAILPDGRYGFSGGWDCVVRMWDISTHKCVYEFDGHRSHITCIACSVDGRWLMAGGEDGSVRVWELVWEYEVPKGTTESTEAELMLNALLHRYGIQDEKGWNEETSCRMIIDMQTTGFGWLSNEEIVAKARQKVRVSPVNASISQ